MAYVPRPTIPVPPPSDSSPEVSGPDPAEERAYFVFVGGPLERPPLRVDGEDMEIGRRPESDIVLDEPSISRVHAFLRRSPHGTFMLEDAGSVNGTYLNGEPIKRPTILREGDRLQFGSTVVTFTLQDRIDEDHFRALYAAAGMPFSAQEAPTSTKLRQGWAPDSWMTKPIAQEITYPNPEELDTTIRKLRRLPPLVTSWEVEQLKHFIAEAQEGKRFLLQGGDCAEMLDECEPDRIAAKLKILLQMSIVLIRSARKPVIRVGRFAGQYAKPRSKPTETRGGVELPSYFGDLVNRAAFTPEARRPDPSLLLTGYLHAAATLNFVRALGGGGFADLRRPEYFDLSYFERASLSQEQKSEYRKIFREISDSLEFAQAFAFGDRSAEDLMRVTFFASHEGLNLAYESAQTRRVPRRQGFYDLTTHLPWIGERTRALNGAHIEFFRGIANPVAVKLGPNMSPAEALDLCKVLNPRNEPGKLVLVPRLGAANVRSRLPELVTAIERARRRVLWVSDPMHGNATVTRAGIKTRNFDDILAEVEASFEVHQSLGTYFGGVHFELTGEDVTECVGAGLTEDDLSRSYATTCDPRLNYRQALEMAFCVARHLRDVPRPESAAPTSGERSGDP